jgi:peptidoglycan/LPS O-acetylase OafA/YrhL
VNRRSVALAADVGCVLLFVVLGRRSHDETDGITSTLNVAAPFLIGLAIGWVLSPHVRRKPRSVRAGLDVWGATVVIGVLLRWLAWDRSTAFTFVLVAAAFLGLFLLGWRVAATASSPSRRAVRSGRPPLEADR